MPSPSRGVAIRTPEHSSLDNECYNKHCSTVNMTATIAAESSAAQSDPLAGCPVTTRTIHGLRAAAALVDRALARALEPHGLTAAQFAVLEIMGEADDKQLGCGELGRKLAGPSSDVTRLLDRLESGGLVSRERDKADRRVVHTRISEKGRELLKVAAPFVRAAEEQALATFSSADRSQLADAFAQVQQNVPGS